MFNLPKVPYKYFILFFCVTHGSCHGQEKNNSQVAISTTQSNAIPVNVQKIMACYDNVIGYKDNYLIFADSSTMIYNDKKSKSEQELLDSPDIEDMFKYVYQFWETEIPKNHDAGRIRKEDFFKKIYGKTKQEVEKQLVTVIWCPQLVNQAIRVTKVNKVYLKVDSLSKELDKHPEFKPYLQNIGGTFNWRFINGTNRLSGHSFGMTIDINLNYSNYWQWDCKCTNEDVILKRKNRIPIELVKIFEKYGFIWGGNWYHYDTMHFEFRPELLLK